MNPQSRRLEGEPISLTTPDIASARPERSLRLHPRLSYKQRVLRTFYTGLLILAGNGPIAAPTVSAQEGPDQNNEQIVDPNQFIDPLVAGIVAEAGADIPPEDLPGLDNPPVDPDSILTSMRGELPPELTSTPIPTTTEPPRPTETPPRICSPWPSGLAPMISGLPVVDGLCYIRTSDPSQVPTGTRLAGAEYQSLIKKIYYLVGGPATDELAVLGHEYAHAHQHFRIREASLKLGPGGQITSWLNTQQGITFITISDRIVSNSKARGNAIPWENFGQDPIEDFANIASNCYLRYRQGDRWLDNWVDLASFCQRGLP